VDVILKDISNALASKQYFVAISVTLTLPGICAALEQPSGSTKGKDAALYESWFTRYLATRYSTMLPSDCYSLRCGVVHQGTFSHEKSTYSRIIFSLPDGHGTILHNIIDVRRAADGSAVTVLNLDAVRWCRDMMDAVNHWLEDSTSNATVIANMEGLVQFRQNGLPPYIVGVPIIA
jgi:hypothetical protein